MSLINDALKKAQKQRTGESQSLDTMPGVGGESAARIARRAKPIGFNVLLLRIGLGAAGLIVLIVGGIFLTRLVLDRPVAPAPVKTAPVVDNATKPVPIASAPANQGSAPAAPAAAAPAGSTPTFTVPATAAAPTPAAPDVTNPPQVAATDLKPIAPAAPAPAPEPEPVKIAPPAPKLGARGVAFVDSLRVSGIRASTTDSKVLMNDRVYRIGDTVEHELGIKLVGISSSSLTFEDERGARYSRNF
jgi:hypothetical protein